MGQVESSTGIVQNNPFVGYGRTPEESIGNLAISLRYYGQCGVRKKEVPNSNKLFCIVKYVYYVIIDNNTYSVRIDTNNNLYRSYVDM